MISDRFESLVQSVERLKEILAEPKTVANRDSSIKRFELTFELAWKTLQDVLKKEGKIARSPREAFQSAFSLGLMEDDPAWNQMIEDRNLSVHTYDEETAEQIYDRLPDYLKQFQNLSKRLKEQYPNEK